MKDTQFPNSNFQIPVNLKFPVQELKNIKHGIPSDYWKLAIRNWNFRQAFTLVELLIVMSIISILVTIGVVSFRASQIQANDAQRRADLRQYQNALEVYANKNNGFYPLRTPAVPASTTLCTDLGISGCPEDPRGAATSTPYMYRTGSGSGTQGTARVTNYYLYATLERTANYYVVCSNGKNGVLPLTTSFSFLCPL